MILLVHLLFGALIGQKILNPFLAIALAFLSHYFLDFFPHIEYDITNITEKRWGKALPDLIKVFSDFFSGIFLIFIFSNNQPVIYLCALFAILPDGLSLLSSNFKNIATLENKFLEKHSDFHHDKLHFLKNKKISNFWRISSQVVAVIICLILFKV